MVPLKAARLARRARPARSADPDRQLIAEVDTTAGRILPRTSISNFVPGLACATGKYVVPMEAFTVGVTVPLRTTSALRPSRNTSITARATRLLPSGKQ